MYMLNILSTNLYIVQEIDVSKQKEYASHQLHSIKDDD